MTDTEDTPLEAALELAATDPAARPEFYRLLVESEVFVLGFMEGDENERTLYTGDKISVMQWQKDDGTSIIPFFASLPALQRATKDEQSYLRLPARSLFELSRGTALVLNPAGPHGKEFLPQEIEALLSSG